MEERFTKLNDFYARYLGGPNTETVLENDLVKVTLSSRGGYVSQVELKKYQTEVGSEKSNILLFRGDNDGYGFRFSALLQASLSPGQALLPRKNTAMVPGPEWEPMTGPT